MIETWTGAGFTKIHGQVQTLPVGATWDSPCCLREVLVEQCFALKLQATLFSAAHNSAAPFLSTKSKCSCMQNSVKLAQFIFKCHLQFVLCSHTTLASVFHFSCAPVSVSPLFFSTSGKKPLSVINVCCVPVCKQSQLICEVYSSRGWQACLGTQSSAVPSTP